LTSELLWAAGIVLAVEGGVIALMPRRLESLLEAFQTMTPEARRLAGLAGLASGATLLTLARILSA
jgi:uncharacterized protein YjeT (DUF2065 family)